MPKGPVKKETKKPAKKETKAPSKPKESPFKKLNDHAGYGHSPVRTIIV